MSPTPPSGASTASSVQPSEPSASKALYVGVGVGAALVGALLTAFVFVKATSPTVVPDPSKPQPIQPVDAPANPPAQPPPPLVAAAPPPATAEPEPTPDDAAPASSTPEPAAPQESELAHVRASASYPVKAIRLDAQQDVINIHDVPTSISLAAGATYRISEPKPPPDSSPLFFWLSGAELRAKDGVGTLSQRPFQVKGATELKVFSLSPLPAETGSREVLVENVQAKTRQRLAVGPDTAANMERAFELKNLDPASTYELTLVPLENGAYSRGSSGGPLEQIGCARFEKEQRAPQRDQQFLLTTRASVNVSNASSLLCGFIDDDPADNQGEFQIRIARTGEGSEWTHPSPYSLARPKKTGELKSAFEQALRLFQERQYDGAAIFAERCISLDPQEADCHLLAGATYASIPGHKDKAISHYESFLELAPTHSLVASVKRDLMKLEQQSSP